MLAMWLPSQKIRLPRISKEDEVVVLADPAIQLGTVHQLPLVDSLDIVQEAI